MGKKERRPQPVRGEESQPVRGEESQQPFSRFVVGGVIYLTVIGSFSIAANVQTFLQQRGMLGEQVAHSSCLSDQPLFTQTTTHLDNATVSALLRASLVQAKQLDDGLLSKDNFRGLNGFVLKYSTKGMARLYEPDSQFAFLLPFLEAAQHPESNAFVLNVLVVPPSSAGAVEAVGLHQDNTVGIDTTEKVLAHTVTVLYLQIPDGMRGGELELFEARTLRGLAGRDDERLNVPDAAVSPATASQVVFRGDAFHRVRAWREAAPPPPGSADTRARVSLVLEQYRVPERLAHLLRDFTLNGRYGDRGEVWELQRWHGDLERIKAHPGAVVGGLGLLAIAYVVGGRRLGFTLWTL